jgi:hypothetical protein
MVSEKEEGGKIKFRFLIADLARIFSAPPARYTDRLGNDKGNSGLLLSLSEIGRRKYSKGRNLRQVKITGLYQSGKVCQASFSPRLGIQISG